MSIGHAMKGSAKSLTKLLWLLTLALPLRAAAETVEYVHTDALGTPIAITDASGNLIETSEYEPYGKLLNRPVTDGPGFTGHVQDAATGLTYMQQRYYDPAIGRFLSVDPVTSSSVTGGNFNRYWYGSNNPYKFKDPDGRLGCTGTHINAVCESGGTAEMQVSAKRTGLMAANQANRALKAAGAFHNYATKEEMHEEWSNIVEPVSDTYGVELGSHTYLTSSGQYTFGSVYSSGNVRSINGFFDVKHPAGLSRFGFIHTHPYSPKFSGQDLMVGPGGFNDVMCKSSNCAGDLTSAINEHVNAALTWNGHIYFWNYDKYSREKPSRIDYVPLSNYVEKER